MRANWVFVYPRGLAAVTFWLQWKGLRVGTRRAGAGDWDRGGDGDGDRD